MRYDFGKVYKEIRESKGLTQEEVCGEVLERTSPQTSSLFYFKIS